MPRRASTARWPQRVEPAGQGRRPALTPDDLVAWRQRVGLTVREVVAWLGVDRSTWGHWTSGRRPIPPYLDLALVELGRRVAPPA